MSRGDWWCDILWCSTTGAGGTGATHRSPRDTFCPKAAVFVVRAQKRRSEHPSISDLSDSNAPVHLNLSTDLLQI